MSTQNDPEYDTYRSKKVSKIETIKTLLFALVIYAILDLFIFGAAGTKQIYSRILDGSTAIIHTCQQFVN